MTIRLTTAQALSDALDAVLDVLLDGRNDDFDEKEGAAIEQAEQAFEAFAKERDAVRPAA